MSSVSTLWASESEAVDDQQCSNSILTSGMLDTQRFYVLIITHFFIACIGMTNLAITLPFTLDINLSVSRTDRLLDCLRSSVEGEGVVLFTHVLYICLLLFLYTDMIMSV